MTRPALQIFLLSFLLSVATAAWQPGGNECRSRQYKRPDSDECQPCPDCRDYARLTGGNATLSEEDEARRKTCQEFPQCRGEAQGVAQNQKSRVVHDLSSLEPVGLGSSVGIVVALCLLIGAFVLIRRRLQQRRREKENGEEAEAEEGRQEAAAPLNA